MLILVLPVDIVDFRLILVEFLSLRYLKLCEACYAFSSFLSLLEMHLKFLFKFNSCFLDSSKAI